MVVCLASQVVDFAKFREIADEVTAVVVVATGRCGKPWAQDARGSLVGWLVGYMGWSMVGWLVI